MSNVSPEKKGQYPSTDLSKNCEVTTDDLGQLSINEGLAEKQIEQLIDYANTDELVGKNTSDPHRFENREAYDDWFRSGRSIYSITDSEGNLLGIVWFGKKAFPTVTLKPEFEDLDTDLYGVTFAIRLYGKARGKGLAKKITDITLSAYMKSDDYRAAGSNGFWLETSETNLAAVNTYNTLFTQVSDSNERGKIVMVWAP